MIVSCMLYLLNGAITSTSGRLAYYLCSTTYKRICGDFSPTLSLSKTYIVSGGTVTEISKGKKYIVHNGDIMENIEDNWCVL